MPQDKLRIATCQFAVTGDIKYNARLIRGFIEEAALADADIVHFSECSLSGYAGMDYESMEGFDWDFLQNKVKEIISLSGKRNIWVVLGCAHRLSGSNKPHNSLYLISPEGKIVDRYDKRFCTTTDLKHYTPGDHFVDFEVNGVKCSLLICFDLRFPELYRKLYKRGVNCVLQSFYNARQAGSSVHSEIMRQTMQCRAATNHFWVSMANSSAWFCPYPSCFIQPDGRIAAQLEEHRDAMMVNTLDLSEEFYDPMTDFRDLAIDGALTNGSGGLDDERSTDVRCL